jgi:hypothetical protein
MGEDTKEGKGGGIVALLGLVFKETEVLLTIIRFKTELGMKDLSLD